jgi:hypothetical protein
MVRRLGVRCSGFPNTAAIGVVHVDSDVMAKNSQHLNQSEVEIF